LAARLKRAFLAMKRAIRRSIKGLALKLGLITSRPSARDPLRRFLAELWPIAYPGGYIRLGGALDGGYVLPNDLEGLSASISPGVSTECSFDTAIAARGIPVYMCDASVDGPPSANPRFHFSKLFLDLWEDETTTTLNAYIARIPEAHQAGDLLLQMDIEGAEYRVLTSSSIETLRKFRVMVVEFHNFDDVFAKSRLGEMTALFRKLAQTHTIVHLHPNNAMPASSRMGIEVPPLLEITFLRKDRLNGFEGKVQALPHPLDGDNVAHHPTVVLSKTWDLSKT
jgi:Methyltransferase FkbM domain